MGQDLTPAHFDDLLLRALREDAPYGDKTSLALSLEGRVLGRITAKQALVVCGLPVALRAFELADPACIVRAETAEGLAVSAGDVIAVVEGPAAALLLAERTALNLLQHLCGVATATRAAVEAVSGTPARIVDTRKTLPGLRTLEKYAVRTGGGWNHRMGLSDGILIKENHIAAAGGSPAEAVRRAKAACGALWRVEVEVRDLEEYGQVLDAGADVVLLDNMTVEDMARAAAERRPGVLLEASGNMTLERLPSVAATGVDLISMGALTHSVHAADLSFGIEAVGT